MSSFRVLLKTFALLSFICVLLLIVTYNSMRTEIITYPTQIYKNTSIGTTQLCGIMTHNSTNKNPDYDENGAIESRSIVNESYTTVRQTAVYSKLSQTSPLQFNHLPEARGQLAHQPLLIVAYQRTGSSFFHTVLNAHPDVISWYEPLDGMFSRLYGIQQGYTVPVDIYADQYGRDRIPPDFETEFIVDALESILTCNYRELPAEVTLHKFPFWSKESKDDMKTYTTCLKRARITETSLNQCWKTHISKICPKRFGISYENGTKCHRLMVQSDNTTHGFNTTDRHQIAMDNYVKCRNEVHRKASKCIGAITDLCDKRKVQAVKTVRARMIHAELLLEHIPDLKVVHLYRKPAPVMPSRRGLGVLSMYGAKNLVKEAELYCKFLVEDILIERRLAKQYPGQVTSYVFQDYTNDTVGTIRKVLQFVGLKMDRAVTQSIDLQNLRRKTKLNKTKNKLRATRSTVDPEKLGVPLKTSVPQKEIHVVHKDPLKEDYNVKNKLNDTKRTVHVGRKRFSVPIKTSFPKKEVRKKSHRGQSKAINSSKNKLTKPVGQKWRRKTPVPKKEVVHKDQSKEVNNACRNLFELVGDIWPDEQFADG